MLCTRAPKARETCGPSGRETKKSSGMQTCARRRHHLAAQAGQAGRRGPGGRWVPCAQLHREGQQVRGGLHAAGQKSASSHGLPSPRKLAALFPLGTHQRDPRCLEARLARLARLGLSFPWGPSGPWAPSVPYARAGRQAQAGRAGLAGQGWAASGAGARNCAQGCHTCDGARGSCFRSRSSMPCPPA